MEVLLFVGVIVAALVALGWRRLHKNRMLHAYDRLPGRSPEKAITLHRADAIDGTIRRERCHCGGKLWLRGEAPLPDIPQVRAALCECYRCQDTIRIYFRIDYLN